MTDPRTASDFRLDGWTVRPTLLRLERDGETVSLEPKVAGVLVRLAESPGEVVTREELLESVWPDVVVGDDVLTRAVSEIRKAFGDDPRDPRVVETIPRVGYRLVAPVGEAAPAPAGAAPQRSRRWRRIALAAAGSAAVVLGVYAILGSIASREPEAPGPAPPEIRPVTTDPGREFTAAFSPDGARLAYAWSREGDHGASLWIRPVDGGSPLRLTDEPGVTDYAPAFSPDGATIAFLRRGADRCAVLRVPALGGPVERVADCAGAGPALAWSADGAWLAFAEALPGDGSGTGIVVLSTAGGEARPLGLDRPAGAVDGLPAISPDGGRLAFVRTSPGTGAAILAVDLADGRAAGAPRLVAGDLREVSGLDWTADGRALVFTSNRSGGYALWRVGLDGGLPTWLGAGPDVHRPRVDPADGSVLYERWSHEFNVWAVPLAAAARGDTSAGRPIARSTRMDVYPALSPDGGRLAFVSDRSGSAEVWVADADGGRATRATDLGSWYARAPRWSPDGERIAFEAHEGAGSDVWVIDRVGEAPRRLTGPPWDEVAPAWSADGRWVYFGSNRGNVWNVWRAPAGGGEPERVTRRGGYAAREGPGGRLYYTKPETAGLWSRPVAGGPETRVTDRLQPEDFAAWEPAGRGIWLLLRASPGAPDTLALLDPAGGSLRRAAPVTGFADLGIAVDPTGRTVYGVREDRVESDLVSIRNVRSSPSSYSERRTARESRSIQ